MTVRPRPLAPSPLHLLPLLVLGACTPAPPPGELHFVRGGVVRTGAGPAAFEARAWEAGEQVDGVSAPSNPDCVAMFHVELEDRRQEAAMGNPPPGAALAFSPDGAWLAIGSLGGTLVVVDARTGAERARRSLPEASAKRVAWSPDGGTLYVGEQSPDATLHAVDPATLADRWTIRLSDELVRTVLPPKDDPYGIYSLPAVFSIVVLGDGTLLVAGSHGWDDADKHRRNLGRLYHLAADGSRIGAWPAAGPADATLLSPVVSGHSALVGVSRSADGPPPADLPIGGVAEVDLTTMQTVWTAAPPVLTPWFRSNFIWDALGLGADFAFAGFGDGRAFLYDRTGKTLAALTPGVPIQTGGVPIAAGVGFGTVLGDTAWFLTTATNIPWGSADPMARPPSAHPAEYTVHAVARDGTPRWTKQLPQATEGIVLSPDGATLLVGGGSRSADQRTDLFGAVLLDAHDGRVVTTCASEGPVDFRPAWAPDAGAFAVTEAPFLVGSDVRGRYQVTVFR